jgi:hypothetical protein
VPATGGGAGTIRQISGVRQRLDRLAEGDRAAAVGIALLEALQQLLGRARMRRPGGIGGEAGGQSVLERQDELGLDRPGMVGIGGKERLGLDDPPVQLRPVGLGSAAKLS